MDVCSNEYASNGLALATNSTTAASLAEISFLTDPTEEARLWIQGYLDRIADFLALALIGDIEEFVDESHFACDPWFDQEAMAASDHAHDLETLDRGFSGLHRLKAEHRVDRSSIRAGHW